MVPFFLAYTLTTAADLKDWQYRKKIEIRGTEKYKNFFLTKEVYQHSNPDLSDLRLIDEEQKTVPYSIVSYSEQNTGEKEYQTQLIGSNQVKKTSYFDFQIIPPGKKGEKQKLKLELNLETYSKQVEVYGRMENTDWEFITKDTVYQIDGFEKNEIGFPQSNGYLFYQVRILDNRENMKIKQCTLYSGIGKKYLKLLDKIKIDFELSHENKISLLKIKNPYRLKLIRLHLTIKGNFKRHYSVYQKQPGQGMIEDSLYHFQVQDVLIQNTDIDLNQQFFFSEEWMVKIQNNDDKPLQIQEITGDFMTDKIVFENPENKSLFLYYGSLKAEKPAYDIRNFMEYIEKESQDECLLGEGVRIGKEEPAQEKPIDYRFLFNILIIVLSVGLIFIVVLKLKKEKK